jgi:MFS family permease
MILGLVFFSAAVMVSGLSRSFNELVMLRVLTGVGEGFFLPAAVIVAGAAFAKNRGAAMGLVDASFSIGLMIGPVLTAALITDSLAGWRTPLIAFGGAGILIAVAVYFLIDGSVIKAHLGKLHTSGNDEGSAALSSGRLPFAAATAMYVAWGLAFWPFLGLAPTYLIKVQNFTVSAVATAAAAGGLGVLLLSIPLGMLADRVGRLPVIAIASAFGVVANLVFFHMTQNSASAPILFFVIEGVGIGALFTNLTAFAQDSAPKRHFGAAIGFVYTIVFVIAAFSGPILGLILPRLGWEWATTVIIVLPLVAIVAIACVMMMLVPRVKPRVSRKEG